MNFYISDLHLEHKNVTNEGRNFDNRPFETLEEMYELIKSNWNSRVTGSDHVYILGDLAWKENERAIEFISTLKGNKHLILGNHCRAKDQRYRQLFVEICDYKEVNDLVNNHQYRVILSHYPIACWNRQHHMRNGEPMSVHLYGHLHDTDDEKIYQKFIHYLSSEINVPCIAKNVGIMMPYMDYMPRTLEEIIQCWFTQ